MGDDRRKREKDMSDWRDLASKYHGRSGKSTWYLFGLFPITDEHTRLKFQKESGEIMHQRAEARLAEATKKSEDISALLRAEKGRLAKLERELKNQQQSVLGWEKKVTDQEKQVKMNDQELEVERQRMGGKSTKEIEELIKALELVLIPASNTEHRNRLKPMIENFLRAQQDNLEMLKLEWSQIGDKAKTMDAATFSDYMSTKLDKMYNALTFVMIQEGFTHSDAADESKRAITSGLESALAGLPPPKRRRMLGTSPHTPAHVPALPPPSSLV